MPKITKDTKIAIGLPRGKTGYDWVWIKSLLAMLSKHPASYVFLSEQAPHASARNRITKRFLETKADYILWIDSDTLWEADDIQELMDVDEDIVTGIQFATSEHHLPLIRDIDLKYGATRPYHKIPEDGKPFEIGGCGFGFVLIKRKVFEAIDEPWFEFKSGFSEDLNFCLLAKRKGFKIVANPNILLGHIGEKVYTVQDFLSIPESMRAVFTENAVIGTHAYLKKVFPNWREDLGFDELADNFVLSQENINLKEGYWDSVYKKEVENNNIWRTYPEKFELITSIVLTGVSKETKILELGAGLGLLASKILKRHPEVTYHTIDISKYAVDYMRDKGIKAVQGVIPDCLEDIEDKYDYILGLELLEHLDDEPRKRTVELVNELLKEGGMAIFTVPDNIFSPGKIREHRVKYNKEQFQEFLNDTFTGDIKVYSKVIKVSDEKRPDEKEWGSVPFLFGICIKKNERIESIL